MQLDVTNERFGKLIAIEPVGKLANGTTTWSCRCDCGELHVAAVSNLRNGAVQNCRSCRNRKLSLSHTRHGMNGTRTWRSWRSMRSRCLNPNSPDFKDYGGRGVTITKRWDAFENFHADMGDRPAGQSLDRKNVNGNYSKQNCKWSTPKEQANNRRHA